MSRIYFHAENESVEVAGPDRHHFGILCADLARIQAEVPRVHDAFSSAKDHWLVPVLKSSMDPKFLEYEIAQREKPVVWKDQQYSSFSLLLNSAYHLGGEALQFAARIHGGCEIHCWVEGNNRLWLAGIIERALSVNVCRDDMGWPDVIKLLEQSDKGEVVCSFSVTDSFPLGVLSRLARDAGLSDEECDDPPGTWGAAMASLRETHPYLEMQPSTWDDYHFGNEGMDYAQLQRLVAS